MDQFASALDSTLGQSTEFYKHLTKEFLLDTFTSRYWWDSDARPAISYSFIKIGLLHLGGLLVLAESGFYVSCLALLRPMIEAYVRGLWLFYCTGDEQIQGLTKARHGFRFPPFGKMVDAIAADKTALSGQLLGSETWKDLCDYTHGGVLLVERFVTTEANSDKARLQMIEAIRNGTKAAGLSILLFVEGPHAPANLLQFVKTLLREYLSDEKTYRHGLAELRRQLEDEEFQHHFESEVERYKQKGDRRNRERYTENPFEE